MTRRAAIYARFSSEVQNARSIEDQIAVCVAHAERKGWTVTATFADYAISGAAMANRPGLLAAVAAAGRGEFDVLLTEHEDRIARNIGHLANVRDELRAHDVDLATLSTDVVETMHVAMFGFVAEQYLKDLGAKTSRGMRSNAERGLATGSRLYGYATAPGGAMTVVEAEADVIRRACGLYADYRLTAREIADILNRERIPGPRGGFWNASTVIGSRERGNGLLRSEVYAGVKVWNRTDVRKDPRTGKRTPHTRPPEEWRRTPVEHLRIVDAELWARVQDRLGENAARTLSQNGNARKSGLFSGILKCGVCGGSYTVFNRGRLVCTSYRQRGSSVCSNSKIVDRALVEARALEGIRSRLLSPAAVAAYVRAYHAAWQRIEREARDRRAPLDRRLAELTRSIGRLVDAICDGTATPAMRDRLVAQEAEKAEIELQLAGDDEDQARAPVALHPGAATAFAGMVERLQATLAEIADDPAAEQANRKLVEATRGLVVKIEIVPNPRGHGGVDLRLHGDLSRFLRPAGEAEPDRAPTGLSGRSPLVAGGSYTRAPTSRPASIVVAVPLYREAA